MKAWKALDEKKKSKYHDKAKQQNKSVILEESLTHPNQRDTSAASMMADAEAYSRRRYSTIRKSRALNAQKDSNKINRFARSTRPTNN